LPTEQPKNKEPRRSSETNSQLMRFGDLAFRMGIMIGLGAFVGQKIDKYLTMSSPIFTIILCLLAIGGSMYMVIREVSQPKQ
jgi:F0F1-type ATP synthase assembly protein I